MTYLDRFKARMTGLHGAYTDACCIPMRPYVDSVQSDDAIAINVIVDLMLGVAMKGKEFDRLMSVAKTQFDTEWPLVEELLAARKAAQ